MDGDKLRKANEYEHKDSCIFFIKFLNNFSIDLFNNKSDIAKNFN